MRFKAVLSDLGNVVAPFNNQRTFQAIAAEYGLTPEHVERVFMVQSKPLLDEYELGKVNDETFHRLISARLGLTKNEMPLSTFVRMYCDVFTVNNTVLSALIRCRRAGAVLGALSNICPLRHSELMVIGAVDIFDCTIVSYRERLRKPSRELMERSCDRLGFRPQDVLFLDDLEENLGPAKEIGMIAHHFTSDAAFLALLDELGVP